MDYKLGIMDVKYWRELLRCYPMSAVTCGVIWVLSLAPIGEIELVSSVNIGDKWGHMLMYGGWVCVMWGEWIRRKVKEGRTERREEEDSVGKPPSTNVGTRRVEDSAMKGPSAVWNWGLMVWMVVMPVLMGGGLELLQAYATTYRSGEWLDMAANSIGVLVGNMAGVVVSYLMLKSKGSRA